MFRHRFAPHAAVVIALIFMFSYDNNVVIVDPDLHQRGDEELQ
jgi:hypothetical protein